MAESLRGADPRGPPIAASRPLATDGRRVPAGTRTVADGAARTAAPARPSPGGAPGDAPDMATSATLDPTCAPSVRRRVAGTALALAAAALAFAETWASMATQWALSPAHAHGVAVLPIAAWLGWRLRGRLAGLPDASDARGALAFVAASGLWLLGRLAGVELIADLAAVAALPAVVLWRHGPAVARALAFPLGFLVFAVPAGDALVPTLTRWTADATALALRAVGVPVRLEGTLLELPTGRWSVVEACSGLHYLVVAVVLAVLFGHLHLRSPGRRLALVAAMIGLSLLANWARAFATVMGGHLTGMRWGTGDEHLLLGWGLFGATMSVAFLLARRFSDAPDAIAGGAVMERAPGRARERRAAPAGASAAAVADRAAPRRAAVAVLAMAAAAFGARHLADGPLDATPRDGFAVAAHGAIGPFEPVRPSPVPAYGGQRDAVRGRWADGVEFALGYWAAQRAGAEMVAQGNRLVPERIGLVAEGPAAVRAVPGLSVQEWVLRGQGGAVRGWTWFVADGHAVASPAQAKLGQLVGTLSGRGDHAALAWLAVEAGDDAGRDRARLAARAETVQAFLAGWTRPGDGAGR
ncbi:MAG: hypothetical protein RJA99_567 [Pseudomonadota bacterium]